MGRRMSGSATAAAALLLAATLSAEEDPLKVESRALTEEFANRLRAALQDAMAESGPAGAIEVCAEIAPQIASELSRRSGAQVGRTSLRIRNPRNLPSDWQADVLRRFEAGDKPHEHFERRDDGEVRYMKAIPTAALCTACHGRAVPDRVQRMLDEHYPHDRATGYEAGDLRGAFSVVWPAQRGR